MTITLASMDVGARRVGLGISETVELLGFSHVPVSRVNTENCQKICPVRDRFIGRNTLLILGEND